MSDDEIRDAMDRAADVVPDPDLSHTAWSAGRSRKRRTSRAWWGAGSAVAAAALVGAIAWNWGALSLPDSVPAGTAGEDSARTSEAGPTSGTEDAVRSGQPTMLTFTSEKGEFELSGGVLELWAPDDGSATTWHLTDELMSMGGPEQAEQHDPNVTLTLEQGTWSVRGCGIALQAPGTVTDGRVVITGDWDVDPDPDPGATCVPNPMAWQDSEWWESLLSRSPLVAQDGTTLLLSGTVGEQPILESVSVGFTRADVTDPQTGAARAATWEDLAQDWVEVPIDDLNARFPDREFVDTDTDPEADLQLTSSGVGELSITGPGCVSGGFRNSWLLDNEGSSVFLDQQEFRTAVGCFGPGANQESLVTGMLTNGAEISVHGDYLVIHGWVDPTVLDRQPPVEDPRPEMLSPAMQLPDLDQLTQADTLLPEVLAVPSDGIPTLAEDPTDTFVAAVVSEDNNALLVLGSDQQWRIAATGVGLVTPTPHLSIGGSPPLLNTSISPTGHQLAYRTNEGIVIVTASTGDPVQHQAGGQYPNTVPNDFLWLDDDRLAVDLREDRGMVIDTATGGVTQDASWNQLREITPWRIAVQSSDDDPTGPVVLQQTDTSGALVDEIPLGFDGTAGGGSALATDRVATVVTTEDPAVIEPEGWQGKVPESVSLVLAYDGTDHYVNVLQTDAHTVTPVRWVDRGTLILRVADEGIHHYVLWDTQNGGLTRLTETDSAQFRAGPVFAQSRQ